MAELTIGQLIKIIIGILVFVAVVFGVYSFFNNNLFEFIKVPEESSEVFLSLLK